MNLRCHDHKRSLGYAYEVAGTSRPDGDLGQEAYVHGTWAVYI
jgi:hypothetical protein